MVVPLTNGVNPRVELTTRLSVSLVCVRWATELTLVGQPLSPIVRSVKRIRGADVDGARPALLALAALLGSLPTLLRRQLIGILPPNSLPVIAGGLARHARRLVFQLAEVAVPRQISVACWSTSGDSIPRHGSSLTCAGGEGVDSGGGVAQTR